jgi:hypothetical protein
MPEEVEKREEPLEVEKLTRGNLMVEIINGVAVAVGLSLLWVSEIMRNGVFRLLDRINVRPRTRSGTPFPPGQPRKRTTVDAQR